MACARACIYSIYTQCGAECSWARLYVYIHIYIAAAEVMHEAALIKIYIENEWIHCV